MAVFDAGRKAEMYQFFAVAFDAVPGTTYWGQLREAVEWGMSTLDVVKVFTSKEQFLSTYPLSLSHQDFAVLLIENVVESSASETAKALAVRQVVEALGFGLSRGEVIYNVFNNLARRETDPAQPGYDAADPFVGVARQLANQIKVGQFYTEVLQRDSSTLSTLQGVLRNVTDQTDVSSPDKLQAIVDAAGLADGSLRASALAQSHTIAGLEAWAQASTLYVDTLDSTYAWQNKTLVTYSFNDHIPLEYQSDVEVSKLTTGWRSLNATERHVVQTALAEIDAVIALDFQEVASNGDIRFNVVAVEPDLGGFAYYPGSRPLEGDVFLKGINPDLGVSDRERLFAQIVVHEVGHALGLKHPFEGVATLPAPLDNKAYSIMSYTHFRDLEFAATWDAATRRLEGMYLPHAVSTQFSALDIQALHAIYGPDINARTGNDVYTVANAQYLTIWDAGGVDTIDVTHASGPSRIDLRGGTVSSVNVRTSADMVREVLADLARQGAPESQGITDWVTQGIYREADALYNGENSLAIVQGAVIENLLTGSGNDQVFDNAVDNRIETGAGNDTIHLGQGGFDGVDGGSGQDTVVLGVPSTATQRQAQADGSLLVVGQGFAVQLVGVEVLQFTDQHILV